MLIKCVRLYGIIVVQNIYFLDTISVNNVVRFTCNTCSEVETCCMGTLIQPDIVLTTSFCANFCQVTKSGKKIHILKIFIYPHYTKYVTFQGNKFEDVSNIALALLEPNVISKRYYVKMSAVEPLTTIGLKAFIPVADEWSLRLQSAVIQRCENAYTHSSDLHVCTGKTISDLKYCQKVQGAPLLLADRLLGMSIVHDCRLMQNIFVAVGPTLFWIRSTIEQIEQSRQKHLFLRNAEPRTPATTTTEMTTRCTRINSTTNIMTTHTMIVEKLEQYAEKITNKATLSKENTTSLDETKNKTIFIKITPVKLLDVIDVATASEGSTLSTWMSSETTLSDSLISRSNASSFPKVMEWFKKEKNRLKEKPQAILVLTQPPPVVGEDTEFIDLT